MLLFFWENQLFFGIINMIMHAVDKHAQFTMKCSEIDECRIVVVGEWKLMTSRKDAEICEKQRINHCAHKIKMHAYKVAFIWEYNEFVSRKTEERR